MSFEEAFAPIEHEYRMQVLDETWGHLAPVKNKIYRGYIDYCLGCYGSDYLNPTVLTVDIPKLADSPWFFDAMLDFLESNPKNAAGKIIRWEGTFRNYCFKGYFRELTII